MILWDDEKALIATGCKYYPRAITCQDHEKCDRCGWNPAVAEKRKAKWREWYEAHKDDLKARRPARVIANKKVSTLDPSRRKQIISFIRDNSILFGGDMTVKEICNALHISSATVADFRREIEDEMQKKTSG